LEIKTHLTCENVL